jgi:hypothetical protein
MKQIQVEHSIIKFTGEYKELKSMGYEFQKMYAGNYRQWRHQEAQIGIWQRGADIEHDRIRSFGYILQMIIDGVELKVRPRSTHVVLYENQITTQLTTDSSVYNVGAKSLDGTTGKDLWLPTYLRQETLSVLKELLSRYWIHTETYVGEHWVDADLADIV